MKRILIPTIVALASSASAQENHMRDMSAYRDCLESNVDLVEKTEPSILDGARIIVDYLCRGQSLAYVEHYDSGDFVAVRDALKGLMSVRAARLLEAELNQNGRIVSLDERVGSDKHSGNGVALLADARCSIRLNDNQFTPRSGCRKIPREAERRRQSIGAMYRWGLAKGYVTADPTAGTEGYGRGEPRNRVLTPDEIKTFWTWLDAGAAKMPPDSITVLKLQLCLGSRVGEIAGIEASELESDGDRLVWTLPAARSKNKLQRLTPLVGTARESVEQALEYRSRGPLFLTALSDRALTSSDVGHALKKRKLPCKKFSSHDLRRTVVSHMDEMGISLDTIAAVVGHQRGSRDTRTLIRHYSRPRLDDRVEAALTAWDERLRKFIAGEVEPAAGNVLPMRRR